MSSRSWFVCEDGYTTVDHLIQDENLKEEDLLMIGLNKRDARFVLQQLWEIRAISGAERSFISVSHLFKLFPIVPASVLSVNVFNRGTSALRLLSPGTLDLLSRRPSLGDSFFGKACRTILPSWPARQ